MLPYGSKDFANAFRTVRKNTLQTAEDIPEDKFDFVAAPGVRPVRRLLAHIALVDAFHLALHGKKLARVEDVNIPQLMAEGKAEEEKPRSKAELIALLRERGEATASWLESLDDAFLSERVAEPAPVGGSKSRFEMLLSIKEHEMHHRGQLMLIQRMLGVVPHLTRERQQRFAPAGARG